MTLKLERDAESNGFAAPFINDEVEAPKTQRNQTSVTK